MSIYHKGQNSWQRTVRLAVMVFTSAWVVVAPAQTPQPPYALFQYSTLTGSGNTITAAQVPVVIAPGVTVYVNATLQFNVDSNGNLTLSSGFPQVVTAPALLTSGFRAGTYVGPSTLLGGKATVTVSGPGVTDGGATVWSIAAAPGADACTYPISATWYVGPIVNSPFADRIKSAGITSTAWSYGIGSGNACGQNITGVNPNAWYSNTLVGVSQVGNTVTIASFTNAGTDKSVPIDQITYRLAP